MVQVSTLTPITDELLAAERQAREEWAEEARAEKERLVNASEEEREAAVQANLAALDEKYASKGETKDTAAEEAAAAASAEAAAAAAAEIQEAKAEEDKLKAEAARLEELMRQLDMSSDEEDD